MSLWIYTFRSLFQDENRTAFIMLLGFFIFIRAYSLHKRNPFKHNLFRDNMFTLFIFYSNSTNKTRHNCNQLNVGYVEKHAVFWPFVKMSFSKVIHHERIRSFLGKHEFEVAWMSKSYTTFPGSEAGCNFEFHL